MICDICGHNTSCVTRIEPHTHEEYCICNSCIEATEYENYKTEVNNTYKEMTV